MYAISIDNVDTVTPTIASFGPTVRLADPTHYFAPIFHTTPPLISVCAFHGALRILDQLLDQEGIPNQMDDHDRHPCHFAAAGDKPEALKRLFEAIRARLEPEITLESFALTSDRDGWTVLHFAAEHDSLSIFEYCRPSFPSAEVFDIESTRCGTPLHVACLHHSFKCFEFLANLNREKIFSNPRDRPHIDLPINFNRELGPKTPIVFLLSSGSFDLIPLGQAAGLDVDAPLGNGWPVIFHAIRQRSEPFVRAVRTWSDR
jgi:ankyrin repeat protein